jgi:hypothetical protein
MNRVFVVCWLIATCVFIASTSGGENPNDDVEEIHKLHRELIEAHKTKNVGKLLAPEPAEVFAVVNGEIIYQSKEERIQQFKQYFDSTEFTEYRDLIDPIVHISDDGTLGWLIARVKISGTHELGDGAKENFDWTWAWIELYEKRNGRWYRIGDVSNLKKSD